MSRLLLVLFAAAACAWGQGRLEILRAEYGSGTTWLDVTTRLRDLIREGALVIRVDIPTLGEDPVPGVVKTLRVRYRLDDRDGDASAADMEILRIPSTATLPVTTRSADTEAGRAGSPGFTIGDLFGEKPGTPAASPAAPAAPSAGASAAPRPGADLPAIGSPGGLRVFYARYGAGRDRVDVRERLRPHYQNNRLVMAVNSQNLGAGGGSGPKTLEVIYEIRGRTLIKEIPEGGTLELP